MLTCGHDGPFGTAPNGTAHCYACCADLDREWMRSEGRITLYLAGKGTMDMPLRVTNWPGSLSFDIKARKMGRHNIAGKRTDVWFLFEGRVWHGWNAGDNDLLHCKQTKRTA